MKNKLIYAIVTVAVLVAVGGGLLLNKNNTAKKAVPTSTSQTTSVPGNTNSGQTTNGNAEQAYVEIAAQSAYLEKKMGSEEYAIWAKENYKNLLTKYGHGVTEAELAGVAIQAAQDKAYMQAVTQKITQRLEELQKTGN